MTNIKLFETYISQHLDSIYRFAFTYTRNQQEAEDVVNDSVIKALKSIKGLREPDHIGTWFYRKILRIEMEESE